MPTPTYADVCRRMLSRRYSTEIEHERKQREAFYLSLGVPIEDAQRLVARILAAYAPPGMLTYADVC